jgi:hypothetical protein
MTCTCAHGIAANMMYAPVGRCVVGKPEVCGSKGQRIIQCAPILIGGSVLSVGSESLRCVAPASMYSMHGTGIEISITRFIVVTLALSLNRAFAFAHAYGALRSSLTIEGNCGDLPSSAPQSTPEVLVRALCCHQYAQLRTNERRERQSALRRGGQCSLLIQTPRCAHASHL